MLGELGWKITKFSFTEVLSKTIIKLLGREVKHFTENCRVDQTFPIDNLKNSFRKIRVNASNTVMAFISVLKHQKRLNFVDKYKRLIRFIYSQNLFMLLK
jgi:hypothetical protein